MIDFGDEIVYNLHSFRAATHAALRDYSPAPLTTADGGGLHALSPYAITPAIAEYSLRRNVRSASRFGSDFNQEVM